MSRIIQVQILGREYALRSHQSEQQVQRVADFVSQMLTETASGRTVDTRDLTVLTLLNLAGKYLQLVDDQSQQAEKETRLRELVELLEHSVSGC